MYECLDYFGSVTPVSYTHLDVYKRQVFTVFVIACVDHAESSDGSSQLWLRDDRRITSLLRKYWQKSDGSARKHRAGRDFRQMI